MGYARMMVYGPATQEDLERVLGEYRTFVGNYGVLDCNVMEVIKRTQDMELDDDNDEKRPILVMSRGDLRYYSELATELTPFIIVHEDNNTFTLLDTYPFHGPFKTFVVGGCFLDDAFVSVNENATNIIPSEWDRHMEAKEPLCSLLTKDVDWQGMLDRNVQFVKDHYPKPFSDYPDFLLDLEYNLYGGEFVTVCLDDTHKPLIYKNDPRNIDKQGFVEWMRELIKRDDLVVTMVEINL